MESIIVGFLENGIKFICFIAIAGAGIICGKKYRSIKDNKKADL